MSPATVISRLLIAEGLFATPPATPWPIYVGHEPEGGADDVGSVFDTAGVKDGRIAQTGENIVHYGVQLRVRARDYDDGWAKLVAACTALEQVTSETIDTWTVHNVSLRGTPANIGVDGTKRRRIFTANFLVTLTEV